MLTFLKKNRKISAFSFCCFFYIQQPDISEMSGLFLSSSMYDLDTTKEGCTYSTPSVHPIFARVLITHCSFEDGSPFTIRNQYMSYRLLSFQVMKG